MIDILQRLALFAAWTCVLILIVLSLAPLTADHRTSLGGHVEHTLAYAGTAFLFGASRRYRLAPVLLGMFALGGLLETAQMLTPFRKASPYDYMWSVVGVVGGGIVWRLLQHIVDRVKANW